MAFVSMLRGEELRTTSGLAAVALVAGSAAGSAANVVGFLAMLLTDADNFDTLSGLWAAPAAILLFMIVWFPAVIVLGGLVWWPLHKIRLRGWPVAIAVGAALPALCVFPILQGDQVLRLHAWTAIYAASGGLAGLTVWRVAYRKRGPGAEVFA